MAFAIDYPANPNIANRYDFISDEAGLLSSSEETYLNRLLTQLRDSTTAEMGVAILPGLPGDEEIQPYSVDLFEKWGLGKGDRDNGLLLVIDTEGRQGWLTTGYGLEGILPDAVLKKILDTRLQPAMREGRPAQGIAEVTDAVYRIMMEPANRDEILSERGEGLAPIESPIDSAVLWNVVWGAAAIIALLVLVMFISDWRATRGEGSYQRALHWRRHLGYYWLGTALSLGLGLPLALAALLSYRRYRDGRHRCMTCGAKMHKLSEDRDNDFLTPSQDLEERLGTVDYDVWECDKCGTVECFPFKESQQKFTECPACHTIARHLECDRIVRPATTRQEGYGVRTYKCEYCDHRDDKPYKIPRKDDGAGGAMVAGAILGGLAASSRGRGGGFGGGSIGGGFGGGHTGGGGAGTHW